MEKEGCRWWVLVYKVWKKEVRECEKRKRGVGGDDENGLFRCIDL